MSDSLLLHVRHIIGCVLEYESKILKRKVRSKIWPGFQILDTLLEHDRAEKRYGWTDESMVTSLIYSEHRVKEGGMKKVDIKRNSNIL